MYYSTDILVERQIMNRLLERGVFLNETIRKHVCPLGCVFEAKANHFYESLDEMHKLHA
jgi:hypothetical protein